MNRGSFAKYAEDTDEDPSLVLREVETVLVRLARTDERYWALYGKVCALLRDINE